MAVRHVQVRFETLPENVTQQGKTLLKSLSTIAWKRCRGGRFGVTWSIFA
jgi:hypothetical protein